MMRARASCFFLIAVIGLSGVGCQLKRPKTVPTRMIEPQLIDPEQTGSASQVAKADSAVPIRLLDTQARGHIGRRLLHQLPSGELTEDPIWRWSSLPAQYLDTAIRQEIESNPNLRLVDSASAPTLEATVLVWDMEATGGTRLVGAVEFQVTGTDRSVHSRLVRGSEPVTGEMPGDLAAAAGRLMLRLASEGLSGTARER